VTRSTAHHILVISDDSGTDRHLRLAFTRTAPECNVGVVHNRKEIEALHTPNLILLDLMLANEPPFDVLRWLRTQPRYTQIPVFVLGSAAVDHDVNQAYALGANSCLLKDPESHGLENIVRAMATYVDLIGTPGRSNVA